jgi:hypothetical protein
MEFDFEAIVGKTFRVHQSSDTVLVVGRADSEFRYRNALTAGFRDDYPLLLKVECRGGERNIHFEDLVPVA